ncbi:MAG: hypothetical protein LBE34_12915 [Flavobacteriaceae bacterium]|jgi:hypothetical protein|nr:hypothetical protein [Flavobacteriaceae bacterium]
MVEEQKRYFIDKLKKRLEEVQPIMVNSLNQLFKGEYLSLIDICTIDDVHTFYFEYDYETLNIVVWAENKEEQVVSIQSKGIPEKLDDTIFTKASYFSLYALEEEWGETEEGLDQFDELIDLLSEEKEEVLTQWFILCWKLAKEQTVTVFQGKFSVHDTNYRTELP